MVLRLLKSQSGFSIVQGLILAAAVAGMAYVGTLLMNEQKLAQRGVQARTNNERLHEMIYSILQNKDHCTATLATFQPVNSTMLSLGSMHDMNDIRMMGAATPPFVTKTGATYASNEKYMNGTLGIESIILTYPTASFENHAVMAITYERLGQGYMGQKIEKRISIKLQKDSADRFQGCYAVETGTNQDLVKDFCTRLGTDDGNAGTVDSIFEWDPATNSCKLKDLRCPIGQIYTGFDSTGVRRCHTIQQWSNLSNFVDTASASNCFPGNAPNVRFVFTTGAKMKVDCGSPTSICQPTTVTCPPASSLGPNFVYSASAVMNGASWTSSGYSPTAVSGAVNQGPSLCNLGSRVNTSCDTIWTLCQYTNTAGTGCNSTTAGCTTPWGVNLNYGDTVTAYQSSSPACPGSCVSETRTCLADGTLSGSYTNQSCTAPTCGSCSSQNIPFDETGGCVQDISPQPWGTAPSTDPSCQCRVVQGTFYTNCNNGWPDGPRSSVECTEISGPANVCCPSTGSFMTASDCTSLCAYESFNLCSGPSLQCY